MMAYSSVAIPADEAALLAADKPVFVAANALDDFVLGEWRTSGSFTSGADATATNAYTYRSNDRQTYLTYPNATSTLWYLIFQLDLSACDVDCLALLVHTLGTDGVEMQIQISNSSNFVDALATLWTVSPSDNTRQMVFLANRYSDVVYIRARFYHATTPFVPKIGELWFGRRRQLKHAPNRPWDEDATDANQAVSIADSGNRTNYVLHDGRRRLVADLNPSEDAHHDTILAYRDETNNGTRGFLWVDLPSTAPNIFSMMYPAEPEFSYPRVGWSERQITIDATEQGPHFLSTESA